MISLSRRAESQLDALRRHFEKLDRLEALRNLSAAISDAISTIETASAKGLPAPRPYPWLARPGRAWIKSGRYWVAYSTGQPVVILGIFYDTADIPKRI